MTAAGDLTETAGNVERFLADSVKRAVADLRKPILVELRRDTGGDYRLSGLGRPRLTVKGVTGGSGAAAYGNVEAGPRKLLGPWRWLEDGTRPRVQGRGQHPGTTAKGTWSRPATKAIPTVERELAARFTARFG